MQVIDEGGGQHEEAADHKVCKVAHKGGGSALEQQLQQNLDALAGHGGAGSKVKTGKQHGNLGEVQLIEGGSQEGQGKVQHMKHRGQSGADADDADPAGGGDLSFFGQQPFGQVSGNANGGDNDCADEHEAQVIGDILNKFVHFSNTSGKKIPSEHTLRGRK